MKTHVIGIVVLVALLLPGSLALYSKGGPVILAGRDEVKALLSVPTPLVLEFFAPWCGHCKSLAPHFKAAAQKMNGLVNFAAVDCDVDKNKQLCGKFQVKGFPTVMSFGASKPGQKKSKPTPYQQGSASPQKARTGPALVKHAAGLLIDVTKSVTSSNIDELRGGKAALLFSDKKKVGVTAKGVALTFSGALPFGIVQSSEEALVKEFGVSSFPSLVVLNGEGEGKHATYTGKLKAPAIVKFLSEHADIKQGAGAEPEPEKKPVVYDRELKAIETAEDWTTGCATGNGLCAIAFLDPDDGADRHARFLKTLEDLMEKHYKNIVFRWANGPEQYAAYEALQLGGGFPNLVLYRAKKLRAIPYKGPFAAEEIDEFFKRALRGIPGWVNVDPKAVKFEKYVEEEDDGDFEDDNDAKEEL